MFTPTEDQIALIKELAYDLLSWKDISYILEVPTSLFKAEFDNTNSKIRIAYQSGRIKRKHELRKPILKMATQGSPQAEMLAIKFLDEQSLDECDE